MDRIMIQLEHAKRETLRKRARDQNISVSEFVRRALDAHLAMPTPDEDKRNRAIRAIGCFRSKRGDVSERHDEIFAEAAQQ